MTRERFRFGVVLFGLIAQIVGGVIVFGFTPHMVFAEIGGAALAKQCLRLAVYSNLSMALLVALILRYAREPRLLRWVSGGGGTLPYAGGDRRSPHGVGAH